MSSNRQFQCGEMWSSSQHASTTSSSSSSSSPPVSQLSSHADSSTSTNTSNSKSLRAFTFNIERGYEWRSIAQQLKQADADIVLLQEVDMFCERTGWVNVADEIAKELKMHVVWGCEFVELASWWRNKRLAGGGSHGNAILSRHKIVDSGCVIHATKPFDWSATTAWNWSEPRLGSRVFLWADIVVPHLFNASPIRCYSIHFENMTGILSRVKQMSEVLDHRISQKFDAPTIIAGDFNTLCHGVVRFLPMAYDLLTFQTFGYSEEDVWRKCLLDDSNDSSTAVSSLRSTLFSNLSPSVAATLKTLCEFSDTVRQTTTTTNAWIYSAKLDWFLFSLRHFSSTNSVVTNQDGKLSDHCCLMVDLTVK